MQERGLPASPNWYCCRCSDINDRGLMGFGAKNTIYLMEVSAQSCRLVDKLVGHRERVSGFSFCQHAGQSHLCVSSSDDGTVKFWDSDQKVLLKEHTSHQGTIMAVHWSPADKNLVVSGDDKGVIVCHWFHTGDTVSFLPMPRKSVFSLACSPHTWSCVAVGYKQGMIALIDVSKKGEVVHRLRGHDDEIHSLAWAPVAGEDALYCCPEESPAETNGAPVEETTGCFLASGCRDQTVRIWSTASGRCIMTLKLPYLKKRGSVVNPGVKERLWLSVNWPRGRPTQILSSCFSGELVLWDLTKTSKQKWTLLGTSSEGQNHNRIVFNMNSVCLQDGRELLVSTSMDREIKCWDLVSLDCCWTISTLGGAVYAMSFSPVGTGCLAVGAGDQMIRVWNTLSIQNPYDCRTFWQGIKSKVTALAWHPSKEGSLAFGTDDGKVGIYDVYSNKPPHISSSYHQKTVYRLDWGPPVPPVSFGGGDKPSHTLYSCGGDGLVFQHDPWNLSGEACDLDRLIKDTNSITHKLSPHTDLSWKTDGKVVAIGNEDGSIEVYQAPSLKLLCSIQQHHKLINTLRWHHAHGDQPELQYLLASGSANAKVFIHDLRSVIAPEVFSTRDYFNLKSTETILPDSPALITEPFRALGGHTAKITGVAWSPHHTARLATVSYDRTAQVWDVLKEEGLSNFRSHGGRLLCVEWSPVDQDLVWTGADDFTIQEWSISKQEFTVPPKGKKSAEMKEKEKVKTKAKQKKKTATEATRLTESPSPVNREVLTRGGEAHPQGPQPSQEEEREQARCGGPQEPPVSLEPLKKSVSASKNKDNKPELQPLLKKKKPRSMLPVSTSMDHRSKEDLLQDCITLATVRHSQTPPAGCVPGQGGHIHLGLFSDRPALYRMFQEEERCHLEAGHGDSVIYLRLWSGDFAGALQLATERGELNDHLLSIAPMAGYKVWSSTVEAYVRQLCLQEQYLKAASHLLSINRLYEAVDLLHSHKLYREAIALVKARLPPEEPVLKELYTSWASVLEKDGHLSAAAKCHLAAGASFDAAKIISKKNDVPSLRAAAGLASITGETGLARSLSLRCAKDLAATQDWAAAQDVLGTEDGFLAHRLHFSVTELLMVSLSELGVAACCCVSNSPWARPQPDPPQPPRILDRIRPVWEREFGVGETTSHNAVRCALQDLKALENSQPTPNTPLKQVLMCSSLHLTRALLSWLLQEDGAMLEELWQATAWCRDAGQPCVSAQLCKLLFPDGDVTVCSQTFPRVLRYTTEQARAAAGSMGAFVNYHLMYDSWWSHGAPREPETGPAPAAGGDAPSGSLPTGSEHAAVTAGGAEPVERSVRGSEVSFDAAVLLCEAHAHFQTTQRSMAELQERLASLVVQHSVAKDPQLTPGEEQEEERPAHGAGSSAVEPGSRCVEQDSLLSLSVQMSKCQRDLAELPETIKMFPHPDVLECCLVLLHMCKATSSIPECLQQQAKDLLGKYATSGSIQKASQRFLA